MQRRSALTLFIVLGVALTSVLPGASFTLRAKAEQKSTGLQLDELVAAGAILPDRLVVQLDEQLTSKSQVKTALGINDVVQATSAKAAVKSFFSVGVQPNRLEESLSKLKNLEGVTYAGPEFIYHSAAEPLFGTQWALHNTGQVIGGTAGTPDADIDAPEAWSDNTGSPSVVVAVVDSGVDWSHVDLSANIWANPGQACGTGDGDSNGLVGDCKGYDFVSTFPGSGSNGIRDDDPSPCGDDVTTPNTDDCNGVDDNGDGAADNYAVHGTHVAGIVAAEQNSKGISGVAPDVTLMPVRALTEDGFGITTDVLAAMDYAIEEGADIINMSFGSDVYDSSFDSVVMAAEAADVVLVAAAGNANENIMSGAECDSPVCNDDPNSTGANLVLSVSATNNRDRKASFSNYSTEGYVDIASPGQTILSTCYENGGTPACDTDLGVNGVYDSISGTSQATPHVAGVAALVRSISPSLSAEDVRIAIRETSDDITSANAGLGGCDGLDCTTGPSGQLGSGRVNANTVFHPFIVGLSPSSGERGVSGLDVTLTGLNTSFTGSTTASFGAGITVVDMSCPSSTSCTATINITDSAPLGVHAVSATTGSQTVDSLVSFTVDDSILRIAGPNRAGTAIEISQNGYPANGSADAVILARSDTFPDSLAGGPLASIANGVILFTGRTALDPFTKAEIERVLDPTSDPEPDIYVLGQTSALGASVESELIGMNSNWQVMRLGGANRVDTAVKIADQTNALRGKAPSQVIVATQSVFADALSAGVAASDPVIDGSRMPILLTDGEELSAGTAAYLGAYRSSIGTVFVVGGTAAVSDAVITQISLFVSNVQRISGADRYETAERVAEYFYPSPVSVSFASGLNFPDAMAGNWHSGQRGSPLLLIRGGETPSATIDYVAVHEDTILGGYMYGGTAVIPDDVKQLLETII